MRTEIENKTTKNIENEQFDDNGGIYSAIIFGEERILIVSNKLLDDVYIIRPDANNYYGDVLQHYSRAKAQKIYKNIKKIINLKIEFQTN